MLEAVVRAVIGQVLCWLPLVGVLAVSRPEGAAAARGVRLLPDLLRLLRRLAADRRPAFTVRARIVLPTIQLAVPIDLT